MQLLGGDFRVAGEVGDAGRVRCHIPGEIRWRHHKSRHAEPVRWRSWHLRHASAGERVAQGLIVRVEWEDLAGAVFDDLSDYDFELLVADLLGAERKRTFETFPRGRDGGIDVRACLGNGFHLVQCKHYANSSFSTLERAAKREQKTLLRMKPRPRRYTFVTSRPLTASNKTKLSKALSPGVRDERAILGGEASKRSGSYRKCSRRCLHWPKPRR